MLWGFLFIIFLLAAGFVLWAAIIPAPMPEALAALKSDSVVSVQADRWLVFSSAAGQPKGGFIFYPGGRVNPRAYAPAARMIAAGGYMVVIPLMPLNPAVFAPGRAAVIMASYPGIHKLAVGGHSLGGAMAADFAGKNPKNIQGLILWVSFPASSNDLSG